jgi:hypothetical protein
MCGRLGHTTATCAHPEVLASADVPLATVATVDSVPAPPAEPTSVSAEISTVSVPAVASEPLVSLFSVQSAGMKMLFSGTAEWQDQRRATAEEAADVVACTCTVLIDTGAGANFVASPVLGHLSLQPALAEMPHIGLINGIRVKPLVTCVLQVTLGTYRKTLDFIVLPVISNDFHVILGGPWCSRFSVDLLHSCGVCKITDAGIIHEVPCADTSAYTAGDIPFVPCHLLSPLQFKRSLKQSEAVCLVMVTPEKSCDPPVADTELNSLLEQFRMDSHVYRQIQLIGYRAYSL